MILGFVPFVIITIGYIAILKSKLKPSLKRMAVRWCIVLFGLSLLFLTVIPSLKPGELGVVIFPLPVVSLMVYFLLRYTKVCMSCGYGVPFSRPYVEPKVCPRCGTDYETRG